ncbi:Tetratricopeptide repeat-containing protein [Micromonospora pallida]|uniref:Tetratricopeptide repeat-containing protein n=1 Tax=Micromonospora pallida TaxID=145854 RepID=A0A1C6T5D4_9ACTN|nr:helix-turn-helix domain-containing protein [Micromonospora pallida]SCL37030.1 Tetratricopeptide repeat-containing protein [Micromonospora pallida]
MGAPGGRPVPDGQAPVPPDRADQSTPESNRLGGLLRRHRTDAGLTIEELAAASGVSVRAISDMERGRSRVPQRRTVEAIVRALDLPDNSAAALREAARAGRRVPATASALAPPRTVADFTGRHGELGWLGDLVARSAEHPDRQGAPVVAVVSGPPGLGKTALMVQAATRYAESFPGGVLFIDLRGLDPDPPRPNDLLLRLLTTLGVEEARVPGDEHARSALYRALLRERRSLLLFDNAADEAQVRPLLPGAGSTMTIITSRRGLAGLEAVDRLVLPALTRGEAVALLQRIIGPDRAAAEPDDMLLGLAQACGHLPLALRIAGNRLLSRPDWSIEYLLCRLADQDDRLDLLVAGDLQVAAPFMLSYRQLSPAAARTFRRLSLIPGPDVGSELAAQATGLGVRETEAALEELAELGLLQPATDGRYRFHDLMRLFARARLAAEETVADRRRVEDRVVTWLLDTAVAAGQWFEPAYAGGAGGRPASAEEARRWIQQEGLNWLGALRAAFAAGRHAEVMTVADAMHWFSDRWTHWGNWLEVYQMSAASAEALGDPRNQAVHLNYVSWVYTACLLRPDLAEAPAREALRLAAAVGDASQQGWAWTYLGSAARRRGDATRAQAAAGQALPLFDAAGDWDGYAQGLSLLAGSLAQAGRHREAIEQYQRLETLLADPARAPSPQVVDLTAGHLHLNVGLSLLALRRWATAATSFRVALPPLQRAGVRQSEARCRYGLGSALVRLGRVDEARGELRRAVRIARRVGPADLADQALGRLAGLGSPTDRRVS